MAKQSMEIFTADFGGNIEDINALIDDLLKVEFGIQDPVREAMMCLPIRLRKVARVKGHQRTRSGFAVKFECADQAKCDEVCKHIARYYGLYVRINPLVK